MWKSRSLRPLLWNASRTATEKYCSWKHSKMKIFTSCKILCLKTSWDEDFQELRKGWFWDACVRAQVSELWQKVGSYGVSNSFPMIEESVHLLFGSCCLVNYVTRPCFQVNRRWSFSNITNSYPQPPLTPPLAKWPIKIFLFKYARLSRSDYSGEKNT